MLDSANAQALAVSPGQTSDPIVFSLQNVPAFQVSGVVVDYSGLSVDGAMVTLGPERPGGVFMGPPSSTRSDASGRFALPNVAAGTYVINATVPVRLQQTPTREPEAASRETDATYRVTVTVTISSLVSAPSSARA